MKNLFSTQRVMIVVCVCGSAITSCYHSINSLIYHHHTGIHSEHERDVCHAICSSGGETSYIHTRCCCCCRYEWREIVIYLFYSYRIEMCVCVWSGVYEKAALCALARSLLVTRKIHSHDKKYYLLLLAYVCNRYCSK
jgi:hypothetical protein